MVLYLLHYFHDLLWDSRNAVLLAVFVCGLDEWKGERMNTQLENGETRQNNNHLCRCIVVTSQAFVRLCRKLLHLHKKEKWEGDDDDDVHETRLLS